LKEIKRKELTEDEEEDVDSYWVTLGKLGDLKRKH